MNKKVLVVVDYQFDFASPHGALYVPQAETISQIIQDEINNPMYDSIIYTMDSHIPEEYSVSDEAKMFPPHCVYGTPGWNFFEIEPRNPEIRSVMRNARSPKDVRIGNEFVFVKDQFDIWASNSKYAEFIKTFDKDTEFYIVGVATNFCVADNAMGYKSIGYENVFVIENAVKAIIDGNEDNVFSEMRNNGVSFIGGN